jgi:hypothetical protein
MNSYQALKGARNLPNLTQRKFLESKDKKKEDQNLIRENLLKDVEISKMQRKKELKHNRELIKSIQREK